MTYPGSGGQWPPQPDPNQPQGWGGQQPGYPQQQPGYPPQQPGYPQTGPQQQGFPQTGPQQQGFPQTGPQQFGQFSNGPYQGAVPPQQPRSRKGLVIGLVIALVVLAGGGIGTWIALANGSDTGSASPHDAAMKFMTDLGNGDLLGVANDLPPAEASVLRDTVTDTMNQMKRLQVVKPSVDSSKAWSGDVSASGITFDDSKAETVNDHLTITKLVGGTITLKSDVITNDFTDQFIHAAFPDGDVPQGGETQTINIANEVQTSGEPIRIATVNVGGSWYPSVFYTIADSVLRSAGKTWAGQSIPDQGQQSPDQAAETFVRALVAGDVRSAITVTAPQEGAVLHDVGPAIVDVTKEMHSTGTQVEDVKFTDQQVTGGTETVLQSMRLRVDGREASFQRDGNCYVLRGPKGQQRLCADQFARDMAGADSSDSSDMPPSMRNLLSHLATGILNSGIGVVTVNENGQWYVSPIRTATTALNTVLGSLQPGDIANMIKLGGN